jgi:hypothetical protein
MLVYEYYLEGKRHVADMDNLSINGTKARLLTQPDLYAELSDLGVRDIDVNTGKHELMLAYARHLAEGKAA